ncbi:hypothetical protein BDV96DRAFT_571475 [Lophiotrema nucula]|uniref:F-box domain-containing protein n=1 Tax=Lophiotrema nucula TaxID=690887 RepID=A0A6A5ZEA4_9PLEO|nr:hypothetical protein BDV96DRAFT_571475 [Lophiotrema nucula]
MFVGSVQWLSQHLATLIWPRRPRPDLGAFALPPEIILMVAKYLTNASTISLALTCRTLHNLCFPHHTHLNTAEKEELLLLLESDLATHHFCHYCTKLHLWHLPWDYFLDPWPEVHLPCDPHLSRNWLRVGFACYLPYHQARLVMNRHLYGTKHGLPLRVLEKRISFKCPSRRVTYSESLHARLVDNELLVLSVRTISHSRGDAKELRDYVESWGHPGCKHLTLEKGVLNYVPVQLPELVKGKTTHGHFAPCDQSFGSCPLCLTDYCIDISWRGERKGHSIKVSVYRQLGDCRSPFGWSWRSMTSLQTLEEPRTANPLEYRPGCVRDRWNKAEGIESRTQSEWVELPDDLSRFVQEPACSVM